MPQSIACEFSHIVFSTKHRQPFIDDTIEEELFAYLGGVCKEFDCPPVRVGGYRDHVHILCSRSQNVTLATLIEHVKKRSSKWIKTKGARYAKFYWQEGYASFSADPRKLDAIARYIIGQRKHHLQRSFQDECRKFFEEFRVEYDERYVWD